MEEVMLRFRMLPMLLALAAPLHAQSEAALREAFEGRQVTIRIAMPGTEGGIDIYPADARPLDHPKYAERLKDNGTAIRAGQTAMVTKVRVKSKHIEFQLDGGGYGTFGDDVSSDVPVSSTPKTKREKNLEAELKGEKDPVRKREINEELDDLRQEREREDARNRAAVADAEVTKEQTVRQRRLEGGSRFNIRYRDLLPAEALTVEGVKAALAEYVDFGPGAAGELGPMVASAAGYVPTATAPTGPRKGMLLREADALFGRADATSERSEGALKVVTRTYATDDGKLTAEFVEGVLIRYQSSSN
jgi:hypothetical protein